MRIGIEMAIQFTRIEFLTRSKGGDSCRKAAYNARTIVKNEQTKIRYNFFTKQDVEKAVKDIPDPTAREQLVQKVLSSNRILELYHDDGESSKYFTTIEVRNEETRIIRIANKINDQVYYNNIYNLKSDIEGLANVSEEQKQALRHILLSTSGVRVLRGRAGTGKSYVLIKAHKLATNRGQKVIGLAPTHKAVSELKSKGYTEVYTVKGFLYNRKKFLCKTA
ncbi:AAA family ATPase [Orientia tsutsugamushi]